MKHTVLNDLICCWQRKGCSTIDFTSPACIGHLNSNINIQLWKMDIIPLVSKPYVYEVTLKGHDLYSKSYQTSELKFCMLRRIRSFQRDTVGFSRSTGFKVTSCQIWRMILSYRNQIRVALVWFDQGWGRIFCQTSNFDSM